MTMRTLTLLAIWGLAIFAIPLLPAPAAAQQTSCITCHEGLGGHLGAPVGDWQVSIHAANGVYCHNCHGGDPADFTMLAMSPDKGFIGVPPEEEIPGICGQCHVGVQEDYFRSVHGQTLGNGGPHCATCHGNHAVQRSTPDLINPQLCSSCHDYGRADEIRLAVIETDGLISELEEDTRRYRLLGIDTEELAGAIFAARNQFHRLFHTVDVDLLRQQTAGIQQELGLVQQRLGDLQKEMQRRKMMGAVFVGLLILAGILAMLLHRSYQREEER
jgi:hypothetical protein